MITIQTGMLMALGFLAASLLGLLVAPAFWSRAVRLTTRRIKDTMPLSEMEIEADRDRIRAEYAIKMHKLETLVEQVKMAAARQQIEINRRDARVNMLEADLEKLRASYEEAQNARRVLEQTVADRLPRVESRLTEAKKVLYAREREVGELTRTGEQQVRALAEASTLNSQQQGEIERLKASLAQRALRSSEAAPEGDTALRAELEGLKVKTREQAQLIARLQSLAGAEPGLAGGDLGAEATAQHADVANQMRNLRARNDDQAAEIARLKAAIAVFEREAEADGKGSIRESKVALKARVQSLEAQSAQQVDTLSKLRGELAAANERLARQAAHFTGELKRLGGATGGSGGRRAQATVNRIGLAERVAQVRSTAAESGTGDRALADSTPARTEDEPGAMAVAQAANGKTADRTDARETGKAASDGALPASAPSEAAQEREPVVAVAGGRSRLIDRIAGLSRTS